MKKGLVLSLSLILVLSISLTFASASFFSNLFGHEKPTITGNVIFASNNPLYNDASLISYYTFDSDASDKKGSNNGIVSGAIHLPTGGKIGGAYKFDGSNDLITTSTINHNIGSGDFAYAIWVKPTSLSGSVKGIMSLGCYTPAIYTKAYSSNWGGYFNGWMRSGSSLSSSNWHHLVMTRENGRISFYKNGIKDTISPAKTNKVPNDVLTIGASGPEFCSAEWYADMVADEVMLFKKALSSSEVKQLYEYDGVSSAPTPAPTPTPTPEPTTCTDSDGGKNYFIKGYLNNQAGVNFEDYCLDSNSLIERHCLSDDPNSFTEQYNCSNGCSDGACLPDKKSEPTSNPEFNYSSEFHSADYNQDWKIDSFEANKVFVYWREGGYHCDSSSIDGYASGKDASKQSCLNHDADYEGISFGSSTDPNSNWVIDTAERLRILELFDASSYKVDSATKDGFAPVTPNQSQPLFCQDLVNKVKNPSDFVQRGGIGYELQYNDSWSGDWWINGKRETMTEYYASWSTNYKEESNYIQLSTTVFDNPNINLESVLEQEIDYNICIKENYYVSGKENIFYVCNWRVIDGEQDLDDFKWEYRQIIWINDNVLVKINFNKGSYLTNEEISKIAQQRTQDFLDSLKNNKAKRVDWEYFDIGYPLSGQIQESLEQCPSEISPEKNEKGEEETCYPYWECKTEPAVCPPHGSQTRICTDLSDCSKQREETIQCSPGICSGCYAPRSSGYGKGGDNICIPYGIRLSFEKGDKESYRAYESEMNQETDGYFNVDINKDNSMAIKVIKDLLEEDVTLKVNGKVYYIREGESRTVYEDEPYEIIISDGEYIEENSITIKDIHYSENPEERYIDFVFNEKYNAYCDFDGEIKQQKVKDIQGNWAQCQNNYECESNVCSSGECVEVASLLKEGNRLKSVAISFVCAVFNPFSETERKQCVANFLGEDVPISEGGSSGGSGPPPIPED
jgi:hypothetical protein